MRWLLDEFDDDSHGEDQRPHSPGDCAADQLIANGITIIVINRNGGGDGDEGVGGDVEDHESVLRE